MWNAIKGVARVTIRIIIEVFHRVVINIFDTLFGFFGWPEKKLRVKIFILQDPQTNLLFRRLNLILL